MRTHLPETSFDSREARTGSQLAHWQRADPHVTYHDGQYLMTATVPEYDRLELRRAHALDSLRDAKPHVIWKRHESGPTSWHIRAPELHRIGGKWYVCFAASQAGDIWAIRMCVLENASPDPFAGSWVEKGQIETKWKMFLLDAATFDHRGARYLAWAQKDPAIEGNTNLYLAKMDTPGWAAPRRVTERAAASQLSLDRLPELPPMERAAGPERSVERRRES